jgi:hypothetical protein
VELEQGFLHFIGFSLLIVMSPLFTIDLSPPHEVCNSPDQAAHYHILGFKLGDLSVTRYLAGLGLKVV